MARLPRLNLPGVAVLVFVFSGVSFAQTLAYDVVNSLAKIEQLQGSIVTATLVEQQEINQNLSYVNDVAAIKTGQDSSMLIQRDDGSMIDIESKTVLILNPIISQLAESDINSDALLPSHSVSLIWGKITTTIDCTKVNYFEVRSSLANVVVDKACSDPSSSAYNETKFSTQYKKAKLDTAVKMSRKRSSTLGLDRNSTAQLDTATQFELENPENSSLSVTVISGSVEVIDRKTGLPVSLQAGEEFVIAQRVAHSAWVLPIDGDVLYGGQENLLSWTAYPQAAAYMIEYNLPQPVFSEDNVKQAEFSSQLIRLTPADYEDFNGLILYRMNLPEILANTAIEARVFALDEVGNVITESVASDRTTVTWGQTR